MVRILRWRRALLLVALTTGCLLLWILQPAELPTQPVAVSIEPTFPRKEPRRGFTEDSHRVVHLDLKGGPPRLEYFRQLLPLLAEQGCDALLIEYEDMFPYTDGLANISAKNAYTRQEVRKLLSWAHDLGMEAIPLVQTFGHLEHALKLAEFSSLRELPDFPQELCPSNPASLALVEEMITQVAGLHKGMRYIHLGADEVFHIAACTRCSQYNPRELFSQHVSEVARIVHRKFPGVTPLIWDDMMRSWIPNFLTSSPLAGLVEPVVWAYTPEVTTIVPHYVWYWYSKTFKRVWVAGAYKGAGLPTSDLPDIELHYKNTKSWLRMIGDAQMTIAGYVLTGWSRFDHFAVLCELLPPSVPSLLLNLAAISRQHVHREEQHLWPVWRSALRCSPSADFDAYELRKEQRQVAICDFPGADLYGAVLRLIFLRAKTDSLYATMTQNKGWMTRYNVRHNFTNPWRLVEDYTSLKTYGLLLEVQKFKNSTHNILLSYFDRYGTSEWIEQKILPLEEKLKEIGNTMEKLIKRNTWPRRPIGR